MSTPYAVEVNVTQAKNRGAAGNLYILDGVDTLYVFACRGEAGAILCDITTREGKSKNRFGYLKPAPATYVSSQSVDGLDPRPNLQHQWVKRDGRWFRR